MRSRNIKPGLFKNEILAECDPLARLLFAGLSCLADREGRLEDRPLRIKAELLPYDNCDVESLISQLAERGFVQRYQHGTGRYIQIPTFSKHQNPHVKEAASTIPAPGEHNASTVQAPGEHSTSPADSFNLIPDSLNPLPEPGIPSSSDSHEPTEKIRYSDDSEEIRLAQLLDELIHENNPGAKSTAPATLQKWADVVRLMQERDGRTVEDIEAVMRWAQADDFWRGVVLSMDKLRKQFDALTIKMAGTNRQPIPIASKRRDDFDSLVIRPGVQ